MLVIDLNQVMISTFMAQVGNHTNIDIDEDLMRHMILNSIRANIKKFRPEYGNNVIIACDDRRYWRRSVFPYYKANRRKARESSDLNWPAIFEVLGKIKAELKEFFPYRVIQCEGAEADDVIGTLVHRFGNTSEKILVLSGDKDFVQLQIYMNVKQYDPVRKKYITNNDPESFVREHIMRGDSGDGIPNFLSPDDCLVVGERQKAISQKKLNVWLTQEPSQFCDQTMLRNYMRNQELVDLTMTPESIKIAINSEFDAQSNKTRSHLFNYFIDKKLKNLIEAIGDF